MTHDEFKQVFERRYQQSSAVLQKKAMEYATSTERLQNFKDGALLLETTPEAYALCLMTKHLISLRDAIAVEKPMSQEFVDEKIGDIINYLILIEAIVTEKSQ